MLHNPKARIALLFLTIIIISTVFFGLVETKQFSAYAACRNLVMERKGSGVWKHTHTDQLLFLSEMFFNDGTNVLPCSAFGIGPFWVGKLGFQTILGCECIKDYY